MTTRVVQLSICISTFNRGEFIAETLESIIPQLTDETELVVLDGASTDNTETIVRGIADRSPQLRYVRLEKTEGFDEKYARLGNLAHGVYCWMFADDDLLKPGAVAAVLEATRKGHSLIVVNAEVRDKDLSVVLQPQRVEASQDRFYSQRQPDRDRLLAETGMYLTYIGAIVMKRAEWNEQNHKKYFGTMFVHVGAVFERPLRGDAMLISHPWIVIRYGNALWTRRSFEIWMFKFPQLIWSLPKYADWARLRVERREPWRSGVRLLMARAMGHYSRREYDQWLAPRVGFVPHKLLCCWIAQLPVAPLNLLARMIVKWIFRKSPSMTLHDLEQWRA